MPSVATTEDHDIVLATINGEDLTVDVYARMIRLHQRCSSHSGGLARG